MKNFTIISYLSLMLATFAMAEEEAPKAPELTSEQINQLRQMYEDFTTKEPKTISFRSRPDEICVRNNSNDSGEICIHKSILAVILLQVYMQNNGFNQNNPENFIKFIAMLEQLKQRKLPELNVDLQASKTNSELPATINFKVTNPSESFVLNAQSAPSKDPKNISMKFKFYAQDHTDATFNGEFNLEKWINYPSRMENFTPKNQA